MPLPAWMLSTWPLNLRCGIGVDLDRHRLAGTHRAQLRLLEIGGDPDLARHEHHQRLADGGVGAFGRGQSRDPAGDWRGDGRARQIGLRLLQGGARLFHLRLGLRPLRLQYGKLHAGRTFVALSGGEAGLDLKEIRGVLLRLLDRDRAGLDQPLVAVVFLLCESERRLRLRGLLLGLLDACLLRRDLRFDAGDARLRLARSAPWPDRPEPGSRGRRAATAPRPPRPAGCPSPGHRRWRR